jgi:hypothetical protein
MVHKFSVTSVIPICSFQAAHMTFLSLLDTNTGRVFLPDLWAAREETLGKL